MPELSAMLWAVWKKTTLLPAIFKTELGSTGWKSYILGSRPTWRVNIESIVKVTFEP